MEDFLGSVFLLAILAAIAYGAWWFWDQKNKEEERLKAAYAAALLDLRQTKSTESRIKALDTGRAYAAFVRQRYGEGSNLFDEVQLQNDLTAYGS